MKRRLRAFSICTCLAVTGLLARSSSAPATYTDRGTLVAGETQFALDLFSTLAAANPGRNITISPYSVSLALESMAAVSKGETQAQILRALHIDRLPLTRALNASRSIREEIEDVEQPEIELGNQFVGPSGPPALQKRLAEYFGPNQRIVAVDIPANPEDARKAVNERTAGLTSRRVLEAVPTSLFTSSTRIAVVSAASLSGKWAERLVQSDDIPFNTAAGKKVSVPRLTSRPAGAILGYASGAGWRAVVVPYEGGRVSMVLIVPAAGRLAQVQKAMSPTFLESIVLDARKQKVLLDAPVFGADQSVGDLAGILNGLGVRSVFTRGRADLTPIAPTPGLAVDVAVHYGALRFSADESGSVEGKPNIPADQTLTIDRPFLYAVMDRPTGTVLFLGRVLDPSVG